MKLKRSSSIWGVFRALISLSLLGFISYYGYQKIYHKVDVMVPIRQSLQTMIDTYVPKADRSDADQIDDSQSQDPNASGALQPAPVSSPSSVALPAVPEYVPPENGHVTDANALLAVKDAPSLPLSEVEEQRIRQEEEYQQLLKKCEQLRPVVGKEVTLQLKYQKDPLRGVLEGYQNDRLLLKIPQGKVSVPYRLMEEPTRRVFFPKENAMYLYRQKSSQP